MANKPSNSGRFFSLLGVAGCLLVSSPAAAQDMPEALSAEEAGSAGSGAPVLNAIQPLQKAAEPAAEMNDFPVVRLRSLDKVTARTQTFEANVGSTVKFGSLFIKVQACRKAPPVEQPEAASFLQIWEITHEGEAKWVFSGWMFASSPGLSYMDHPIYDVWVLDCLSEKGDQVAEPDPESREGEGELEEKDVPQLPETVPQDQQKAGGEEIMDSEAWDGGAEAPVQEQPPFGDPADEIRVERLNE